MSELKSTPADETDKPDHVQSREHTHMEHHHRLPTHHALRLTKKNTYLYRVPKRPTLESGRERIRPEAASAEATGREAATRPAGSPHCSSTCRPACARTATRLAAAGAPRVEAAAARGDGG